MNDVSQDDTLRLCGKTKCCTHVNASYDISFSQNIFFSKGISFSNWVIFSVGLKHKNCVVFNRELLDSEFRIFMNLVFNILPHPPKTSAVLDIASYWKSITAGQWEKLAFLPSFDSLLMNEIIAPYIEPLDFMSIRNAAHLREVANLGITVSLPDE